MDQSGVVFQHLLEVRQAPVLSGRVAEEAAIDVVARPATRHLLERVHRHPAQLIVGTQDRLLEQEQDRLGLRKFRRVAESAVFRVVCGTDGVEYLSYEGGLELACAPRNTESRALSRFQHAR